MHKTRTVVHYRHKLTEFDSWDVGVPGLVLIEDGGKWIAVHSRSGATLGVWWSGPEWAVAAVRLIGDMFDWTRPIRDIYEAEGLEERVMATGERLRCYPPGPEMLNL